MSFSTPTSLKRRMSTVKAAQLSAESGDVPDDTAIQAALDAAYGIIRTELSSVVAASTAITDTDDIATLTPVEEALALVELYGIRRDIIRPSLPSQKSEIDLGRDWAMSVLTRIRGGQLPLNSSSAGGDILYHEFTSVFDGSADL